MIYIAWLSYDQKNKNVYYRLYEKSLFMKKILLNPVFTFDEDENKKGVVLSFKKFSELIELIEDLQDMTDVEEIKNRKERYYSSEEVKQLIEDNPKP